MRHILLAADGSGGADRAAEVAAKLAQVTGSSLSILTVGGNVSGDEMRQLARAEGNVADALEALSNQVLQQARNERRAPAYRMSMYNLNGATRRR